MNLHAVMLILAIWTPDGEPQIQAARMDTVADCLYVQTIIINDYAALLAAEEEMDYLDVEPRTQLITAECHQVIMGPLT